MVCQFGVLNEQVFSEIVGLLLVDDYATVGQFSACKVTSYVCWLVATQDLLFRIGLSVNSPKCRIYNISSMFDKVEFLW